MDDFQLLTEQLERQKQERAWGEVPQMMVERLLSGLTFGLTETMGEPTEAPTGTLGWLLSAVPEMAGFILGPGKILGGLGLAGKFGKGFISDVGRFGLEGAIYSTPKSLISGDIGDIPEHVVSWGLMGGLGSVILRRLGFLRDATVEQLSDIKKRTGIDLLEQVTGIPPTKRLPIYSEADLHFMERVTGAESISLAEATKRLVAAKLGRDISKGLETARRGGIEVIERAKLPVHEPETFLTRAQRTTEKYYPVSPIERRAQEIIDKFTPLAKTDAQKKLVQNLAESVKVKGKEPWRMTVKEITDRGELPAIFVRKTGKVYTGESHGNILVGLEDAGIIKEAEIKAGEVIGGWKYRGIKGFVDEKYLGYKIGEKPIGIHEGFVRQALAEGKHVPPEVLKDYPDLVKQVKPALITPLSGENLQLHNQAKVEVDKIVEEALVLFGRYRKTSDVVKDPVALQKMGDYIREKLGFPDRAVEWKVIQGRHPSGSPAAADRIEGFPWLDKFTIKFMTKSRWASPTIKTMVHELQHAKVSRHSSAYRLETIKLLEQLESSFIPYPRALVNLHYAQTAALQNALWRRHIGTNFPKIIRPDRLYNLSILSRDNKTELLSLTGEEITKKLIPLSSLPYRQRPYIIRVDPLFNPIYSVSTKSSHSLMKQTIPVDDIEGVHLSSVYIKPFEKVGQQALSISKTVLEDIGSWFSKKFTAPFWRRSMQQLYNVIDRVPGDANLDIIRVDTTFANEASALTKILGNPLKMKEIENYLVKARQTTSFDEIGHALLDADQKILVNGFARRNAVIREYKIKKGELVFGVEEKMMEIEESKRLRDKLQGELRKMVGDVDPKSPEYQQIIESSEYQQIHQQLSGHYKVIDDTTNLVNKINRTLDKAYTTPEGHIHGLNEGNYMTIAANADNSFFKFRKIDMKDRVATEIEFRRLYGGEGITVKTIKPLDLMNKPLYIERLPWDVTEGLLESLSAPELMALPPTVRAALEDAIHKQAGMFGQVHSKLIEGYKTDFKSLSEGAEVAMDKAIKSFHSFKGFKEGSKLVKGFTSRDDVEFGNNMLRGAFGGSPSELQNVRQLLGVWYLALKPAYVVQNLSQFFLTDLPDTIGHVGWVKGLSIFNQAMKDAFNYTVREGRGVEKGLKDALDLARKRGDFGAEYTEAIFGKKNMEKSSFWRVLSFFQTFTEFINRTHSYSSAYQIAKAKGMNMAGGANSEVYNFAKLFINRTQFGYRHHAMPLILQEKSSLQGLMKSAYMFKNFNWQMMHRLFDIYFHGKPMGNMNLKVAQAMTIGMLGGVMAIPGSVIMKKVLNSKGIDMEEKIENYIKTNQWGGALSDALDDSMRSFGIHPDQIKEGMGATMVLKGLPSIFNVETTNWIGAGDLPINSPSDIYGVLAGIPDQVKKALRDINKGDLRRVVDDFGPSAVRNLMKAMRWIDEGVRTEDGELLFEPSKAEIIKKMFSIPIARERRVKEARYITGRMIENRNSTQHLYTIKISKALFDKDYERVKEVMDDLRDHNAKVQPWLQIKVTPESIRHKMAEMTVGAGIKGIPRRMREEVIRMRERAKK